MLALPGQSPGSRQQYHQLDSGTAITRGPQMPSVQVRTMLAARMAADPDRALAFTHRLGEAAAQQTGC